MKEEEVLNTFGIYAEENGCAASANLLFRLMVALMNTGDANNYSDEMESTKGTAKITVHITQV